MCQTKLNGKRQKQIVINYQKMIQNTQINTLNKKSTKYKIHIKKTLNQEKPTKRKNTKNTKQKNKTKQANKKKKTHTVGQIQHVHHAGKEQRARDEM